MCRAGSGDIYVASPRSAGDCDILEIDIINISKLDKMTVSQSLKKLSTKGLVNRSEHTEDTRAKAVELTSKGKTLAKKLVYIVEEIDRNFFGTLEEKQRATLIRILRNLTIPKD